jgi:AhpD family alkylhydroperoxidase
MDQNPLYPEGSREMNEAKAALAPPEIAAWRTFSKTVFQPGALDAKTKQLIAVAVAHAIQCPYCIRAHTRGALNQKASPEEIMEAVWVAAEMRAGATYAHANIAIDEIQEFNQ